MTTAYTSLLGLALPVTGELSGTWGDTVNNNITAYLDSAIAGAQVISGSLTAVTLSKTTGTSLSQAGAGSTGSSQYQIIRCTGNPASTLTVTVPAADKIYIVTNATSTSQSVKIVGAGPTTGTTIAAGINAIVAWNGSDFVTVASTAVSSSVANLSGGVASQIPYQSAPGTTAFIANGTSGQVLTSNGASVPTWTTPSSGVSLSADNTWTGAQSFTGSTTKLAEILTNAAEVTTVSATAATGTINYDVTTQSVLYYTSNASANWTLNIRGNGTTSLNTLLATGQSITVAFLATQGATAYYASALTIDGTSVTPKYQGGTAWAAGNASGIDAYVYTIIKTASATFTVIASQTQYK